MLEIPQMGVTAWFWGFLFLLFVIIFMRNLVYSSEGRAIMSVREDETAAKAMGIDVAKQKLLSFVIGSLFAGIGGSLYALTTGTGFLSPGGFDFLTGFNPLIIVVFGGLGSMSGAIAASFGWVFFLPPFYEKTHDVKTESSQWLPAWKRFNLLLAAHCLDAARQVRTWHRKPRRHILRELGQRPKWSCDARRAISAP
jgi:ABC-type branched-subunit amino acid transport system permease subunit